MFPQYQMGGGGNPWAHVADQYSSELHGLQQTQQQGMNQAAQTPASISAMFQQAYLQEKERQQAEEMRRAALERQAAQDQFQRDKFNAEEARQTQNMEWQHEDRGLAAQERVANAEIQRERAKAEGNAKLAEILRKGSGDPKRTTAIIKMFGGNPEDWGTMQQTGDNVGPGNDEFPVPEFKNEMTYEPGEEWAAKKQAGEDKIAAAALDRTNKLSDKKDLLSFAASLRPASGGGLTAPQQLAREKYEDKKAEDSRVKANAYMDVDSGLAELEKETKRLATHPGLSGVTGQIEGRTEAMDWTSGDRSEARAKFKEIKARILINVLTTMKMATKTGASGFGSLSLPEQEAIENSMAALSLTQDEASLKKELLRLSGWAKSKRERLAADVGGRPSAGQPATPQPSGPPPGTVRTSKKTGVSETWNGERWE